MQKALYAYFGELGVFEEDIPGHSLYQIGLIDSLSEQYETPDFDFYNYIDDIDYKADGLRPIYPEGEIFKILHELTDSLIDRYRPSYSEILTSIANKEYSKLFLKARFRNLSTLSKKLKDTDRFESIITHAINSGYESNDIIILDTDLSMSELFHSTIKRLGLKIEIPSITMPGISRRLLKLVMQHWEGGRDFDANIMYYGNLDFTNYKEGQQKNPIITDVLNECSGLTTFSGLQFTTTIATKKTPAIDNWATDNNFKSIHRSNREEIWRDLGRSILSINVSKDKYIQEGFVPARVYESIIMGVIPVSYGNQLYPAMSFNYVSDFVEIAKFLVDCSWKDYYRILQLIASDL